MRRSIAPLARAAALASRPGSRSIYYGVNFPVTKHKIPLVDLTERSTSETDKHILAAAIAAIDPVAGAKVDAEKNWRKKYGRHLVDHVKLSAMSDANAIAGAEAGLGYMYDAFDFTKNDGKIIKFKDALQEIKGTFHTGTISGTKPDARRVDVEVPYKNFKTGEFSRLKGQALIDQNFKTGESSRLEGQALIDQVDRWVDYGSIEADCGQAIKDVVKNPGWLDLKDHVFVLKELGAHIVAVDLDQPKVWQRLIEEVQYNSHATISFPMSVPYTKQQGSELYSLCGANFVTHTPEVRNWLMSEIPVIAKDKHVTVGSYAYLDGELHVRVNLACDAIATGVMEAHGVEKTSLHYLPTPTDSYVISAAANQDIKQIRKDAPTWMKLWSPLLSRFNKLVENHPEEVKREDGSTAYVMDALMAGQGGNYAIAKRLQQWRAILSRQKGATVHHP
ncbi:hypothetical protein T484DRAFT_1760223 [Baffinella frigidus]|nr:hypothetical protein T484DRAFT_1760223 [Cryptophyta sp. CCMP2293]